MTTLTTIAGPRRSRRGRGRLAALALTALSLGGAGVLGAPQAAQAAPACAAGWDVYEGSWHLESGFPARLSVTCDAAGRADWVWSTPFLGEGQHYQQNTIFGAPYLERWSGPDSNTVIMQVGNDWNHIQLSSYRPGEGYRFFDLYRG